MNKQVSYKIVCLIFAVLVICFAVAFYAIGAWTEPTAAPPDGNVPAPLNGGPNGQSKEGGLVINTGGASNGLIVDKGNVGIGTTAPSLGLKLDVEGKVGATEYCDNNGNNCVASSNLSGTGAFGAWEVKNANTNYVASTDGIVVAYAQSNNLLIEGLVDGVRTCWENSVNAAPESVTMPVKKGSTWRINFSAAPTTSRISWIPLGN